MAETSERYFIRVRGKILGPFQIEQLKTLRSRGRFSRVHEYSTDRRNWQPASKLSDVFPEGAETRGAKGQLAQGGSASSPDTPPESHSPAMWHYLAAGEEVGPISLAGLLEMVNSGKLPPSVPVWKDGLVQWTPAEEVTELSRLISAPGESLEKHSRSRRWILTSGILLLMTVTAGVVAEIAFHDEIAAWYRGGSVATTIEGPAAEKLLADTLGFVVCGFSVVSKDGTLNEIPQSMGTCFLISPEGYAVTNKHVIEKIEKLFRAELLLDKIRKELLVKIEPKIWVFFNHQQHSAEIVHSSGNFDLAILKVDSPKQSFLKLSASQTLQRGQRIFALGFPAAAQTPLSTEELYETVKRSQDTENIKDRFKNRDFQFVQTDGSVSRVTTEEGGRLWIQHNADINPGNSGGPLLTSDGLVRGVNTLGSKEASGLFYSVGISQLRDEISKYVPNAVWE